MLCDYIEDYPDGQLSCNDQAAYFYRLKPDIPDYFLGYPSAYIPIFSSLSARCQYHSLYSPYYFKITEDEYECEKLLSL
jgi:hypothetical protein